MPQSPWLGKRDFRLRFSDQGILGAQGRFQVVNGGHETSSTHRASAETAILIIA